MRIDERMRELAERQHALVATWQARALGATRTEIDRLRRLGEWVPRSRRVLALAGAPTTVEQALMAAVLDASPGAAVSGPSAAWMWDVPGFRPSPIDLVRPRGMSRRASGLATVHEVLDLQARHLKVVNGIPVVSPAWVVCDLASTHPHRVERVLDRLWSHRLLDGRTFRRTVDEFAERGRAGSALLHKLDAARGPDYVPPASGIEARFMEICLWRMRRQVDSGGDEWCGRVDFRDLVLPLVVEVQSEKYHAALVDKAADASRRERLQGAGFEVVEVWDREVWHEPQAVNERIREARWRLRAHAA